MVDVQTGQDVRVIDAGACYCVGIPAPVAAWSPDGDWIAVSTVGGATPRDTGGAHADGLYLVRPDGSDLHRVAQGEVHRAGLATGFRGGVSGRGPGLTRPAGWSSVEHRGSRRLRSRHDGWRRLVRKCVFSGMDAPDPVEDNPEGLDDDALAVSGNQSVGGVDR